MKPLLALSLCGSLIGLSASAQTMPEPSTSPGINSRSEEVVLDLIARDKKGRPIRDLIQSEITVIDNGVSRPITSFRMVQGTDVVSASGDHRKLDPLRQVRLVSLVFEGLDINSRRMARQAASTLLDQDFQQNVYMAVFALDHKLNVLQSFTNDRALLRKAVERATSVSGADLAATSALVTSQAEQFVGPNRTGTTSLEERVTQMPGGGASMNKIMAQTLVQMLRFSDRTDAIDSGRASIFGLLAAVQGQYQLPGRKTIVYFTPGFFIPQGTEEAFQSVISAANKYNVSFYPVDARGLTTTNQNDRAVSALSSSAFNSRDAGAIQPVQDNHLTIGSALSVDTAIESSKLNTQDTLAILASETGGFLVANTNDLATPLHKISEDIDSYYEVSYAPQIVNYDGSFRNVSVTTTRPDLHLQSRSGYFALPSLPGGGTPLDAYEIPLLRALNSTPLAQTFAFESGGLHYRSEGRNQTCEFIIDMPMANVSMQEDKHSQMFEGGLSYVALVKNADGAVVKKLRGDLPARLRPDQLSPFLNSRFTSMEYFDAPPGHYTLETAVLDRQSGHVSAHRSAVYLPRPTDRLALSSIALIRSWKPKEDDSSEEDPFVVAGKMVTPTLTSTVAKSRSKSLPLYIVIYPDADKTEKPEISIEFFREGKTRRVAVQDIGSADSQGRIQYVASAPIDQFEPGNYEVRLVVKQGNETAQEAIALTLEP